MEKWMKIEDYPNYSVSNFGNVKNELTGKLLNYRESFGYNRVRLYKNGKGHNVNVHRLVGLYFVENPDNKRFINHKDGVRDNNHYTNLEWVTNQENMLHKCRVLGKLNKEIILIKNGEIYTYSSLREAAEKLGLCRAALSKLSNGIRKSHKGYKLYKNN
jgi:hypothetical protein